MEWSRVSGKPQQTTTTPLGGAQQTNTVQNAGLNATGGGPGVPRGGNNIAPAPALTPATMKFKSHGGTIAEPKLKLTDNTSLNGVANWLLGKNLPADTKVRVSTQGGENYIHFKGDKAHNVFSNAGQKKEKGAVDLTKLLLEKATGNADIAKNLTSNLDSSITIGNIFDLTRTANRIEDDKVKIKQGLEPMWDLANKDNALATKFGQLRANKEAANARLADPVNRQADIQSQQGFRDGTAHADSARGVDYAVSEFGGLGTLATTDRNGVGIVLKFHDPVAAAKADYVSSIAQHLQAELREPLPFDVVLHEKVDLPPDGQETQNLKTALHELATDPNADDRTKQKAPQYFENIDRYGAVSKFNKVDATELSALTFAERVMLIKSDLIAQDFGKASVFLPIVGPPDHAQAGTRIQGATNLNNVMLGTDGRLKIIDLETRDDPRNGKFGPPSDALIRNTEELVDFFKDLVPPIGLNGRPKLTPEEADARLDSIIAKIKGGKGEATPFTECLKTFLSPSMRNTGALFDNSTEGRVSQDVLTPADERRFVANVFFGALQALKTLRDEHGTFADAFDRQKNPHASNSNVANPDQTFRTMATKIDEINFPTMEQAFKATYSL